MGDLSFFRLIEDLAFCRVPLVTGLVPPGRDRRRPSATPTPALELTTAGRAVLAGEDDHVALNGIDRWWGGTHQTAESVWRYDRAAAAWFRRAMVSRLIRRNDALPKTKLQLGRAGRDP